MSDLDLHLARLMTFSQRWTKELSWSRVLFVEEKDIEWKSGRSCIARSALWTHDDYRARFDEHLNAGHGWINMNAAGVLDGSFVVVIELPNYQNTAPRDRVSVNISGPIIDPKTHEPRWNAADTFQMFDD
jgi:hypothetical protein